ncbi:MAG: rhodanese-like domain-containing protein [Deltaproteobacteria bacterium]|nr:rhodanese-like domain-containing protein [Deltaproteobacteria bacterium]
MKGLKEIFEVTVSLITIVFLLLITVDAYAKREIEAFVSPEWLGINIFNPRIVVLDVRSPEEYKKGHIPGAINVPISFPSSAWTATRGEVLFEVPSDSELSKTISSAGIKSDSWVIIVGRTLGPMAQYAMADATRVAVTLIYAGIENVAILDGGFDKWMWEGKAISKKVEKPIASDYQVSSKKDMFVTKEYVKEKIGKTLIVDARDAEAYFGVKIEPWGPKPGHIPTAKSFPTPWLWNATADYTAYRDLKELKEIAKTLIGDPEDTQEIIVYCGVGGYASTMAFVLREALGYKNVKIYDGSIQEWSLDPDAPLVKYRWE